MNSLKVLLVLTFLMALLIGLCSAQAKYGDEAKAEGGLELQDAKYHRGPSRFFKNPKKLPPYYVTPWGRPRALATCDKFPRVCHVKGSPGHDCCKKRCVNVKIDNLNCGRCGLRCRFPEVCCNGRCVNIWNDKKHCGGCQNKCKRGSVCYYGMCSYA